MISKTGHVQLNFEYFDLGKTSIDEKPYQNILVHNISYKTLFGATPLRISFNKIDGFIKVYDGTRYLVLFRAEKYDIIYNRIRFFVGVKSGITYIISHNYAKIKVYSSAFLPLERLFIML